MQVSGPVFFIIFLVLAIISAGALPFVLGFLIQSFFIRYNVPKYIPWIIATIIMVLLTNFSDRELIESTHNSTFFKLFLFIVSVVVISGFMDSGVRMRRKLRDRKSKDTLKQSQNI